MLKEKCKKWEQKYETVSDDLNFITFFQEMSPKTFAAIEIGSNAVRMIVGELRSSCRLCVLERWSAHLRLGDSVFECGEISEQLFQQLLQTIQGLLSKVHKYSDLKLSITATSAMRSAKNNAETAARIESIVGYPLKILSGTEECQCLADGVKSFLPPSMVLDYPLKQTFLADLGGGSLEISLLKSGKSPSCKNGDYQYSIDIGSLRLRKMVNPENELKSVITEKLLQLDEVLSANPHNRTNLILTGGNAKTFARLYPQVSANIRPENSSTVEAKNWLSMNWTEFECTEQIFQSQSADEQIEQWKLRPQQTEVFNSALAVFRAIGSKLRTEQLCIPFFGLKESLLLSLVSVVTEKPMEDFTLVLIYGPPKKYKIGA